MLGEGIIIVNELLLSAYYMPHGGQVIHLFIAATFCEREIILPPTI